MTENENTQNTKTARDASLADYHRRLAESKTAPPAEREALFSEVRAEVRTLKAEAAEQKRAHRKTARAADELATRLRVARRRSRGRIPATPSNAVIDLKEEETRHFARGLSLYKIMLMFVIGSVVGVVIEFFFCLATTGRIENRSGVVFGPFNLLYGCGAVALTACLYRFRHRNSALSFFGGMLIGGAVEYLCSFFQELIYGTRSWDYSYLPFNINGRICLLYTGFWGILGVLWIKNLYPLISKWILKIPNKIGKPLTWIVTVLLLLDFAFTQVCLARWTERVHGEPPSGAVEAWLDEHFDDARMRESFVNMRFE